MAAPSPQSYVQGQSSVSADNLNTFIQTVNNIAQLRTFVGLPGMQAATLGSVTVGDRGNANYYWNSSATALDNGTTVIRPTGLTTGAWILVPQGTTPLWGGAVRIVTLAANAPVQVSDQIVSMQIPAASATINLPAPATSVGRVLRFKDGLGNASTWPTTFNVTGGARIDGALTYALNMNWQSVDFFSDGTQWSVS